MQVHRCPECGGRLKTNYCDICMRRVPFPNVQEKVSWQHEKGASAHDEKHPCITFGDAEKPKPRPVVQPGMKKTTNSSKKILKLPVIVVAVISLVSSLFGVIGDILEDIPTGSYEVVVEPESLPEDMPAIVATELYNGNGIRLTADSAGMYNGDYAIWMTIENTTDQDITLTTDLLSVNGIMYSNSIYHEVPAGESASTYLPFYAYEMERLQVEQVAWVEFLLNVRDEDYIGLVEMEPIYLETEAMADYEAPLPATGLTLYDDGGLRMLCTGLEVSQYGDCDMAVYMENLSDLTVNVTVNSVRVNGQEVDGFLWDSLRSGKQAIDSIYIYGMEEMEIIQQEQIHIIELDVQIDYVDGWETVQMTKETITFAPEDLSPQAA